MILNFEAEIGDKLYDCDAGVSSGSDGGLVVDLLEIRLVGEDGASFSVVKNLPGEVLAELRILAAAERHGQIEGLENR